MDRPTLAHSEMAASGRSVNPLMRWLTSLREFFGPQADMMSPNSTTAVRSLTPIVQ
jgi:hypothetical protein